MKKYISVLISFMLLFTSAAFAVQKVNLKLDKKENVRKSGPNLSVIKKGVFSLELDGIINYLQMFGKISDTDGYIMGTNKNPALSVNYFVLEGLAPGISASYQIYKTKIDGYVYDGTSWSLGPKLSYYYDIFSSCHVFGGLSVLYEKKSQDVTGASTAKTETIGFDPFVGFNYMLLDNVGVYSQVSYTYRKILEKKSTDDEITSKQRSALVTFGLKLFI